MIHIYTDYMSGHTPTLLIALGLAGFSTGVLLICSSTLDITRIVGFIVGMASFPVFGFGFAAFLSTIETATS